MENQTRQLTKLEKFMNCDDDYLMRELALSRAMDWIAVCDDEEAHF
jgi:hypothetical protein